MKANRYQCLRLQQLISRLTSLYTLSQLMVYTMCISICLALWAKRTKVQTFFLSVDQTYEYLGHVDRPRSWVKVTRLEIPLYGV